METIYSPVNPFAASLPSTMFSLCQAASLHNTLNASLPQKTHSKFKNLRPKHATDTHQPSLNLSDLVTISDFNTGELGANVPSDTLCIAVDVYLPVDDRHLRQRKG